MRYSLLPASASRTLLLLLFLLSLLSACAKTQNSSFSLPESSPPLPSFLPFVTLPLPPETWSLTGSTSFYLTLYDSTVDGPTPEEGKASVTSEERDDRIITGVAADLVVKLYKEGTLTLNDTGEAFVIARSKDLLPIPPKNLELGKDPDGFPFLFTDVTLWVRDALTLEAPQVFDWWPWWLSNGPEAFREKREPEFPDGGVTVPAECLLLVNEVKQAVQRERQLEDLRQELSLIAYGEESVWDGEQGSHPLELRTYDLLLDIAGAGNILGTGGFSSFFDEGGQGEQCDSVRCPQCLLPNPDRCGNGGVSNAEQCDDGNRIPGDGCDAFCQVEGHYCGNLEVEPWEACDDGKECPDGMRCSSFADCYVGGKIEEWSRICLNGNTCTTDAECGGLTDSCRYVFDGVCFAGGMVQTDRCNTHQECSSFSQCGADNFCTNLPFAKGCAKDTDCASCSFEVVFGTCAESGERCNGDEDCPESEECILAPEEMCRPRTVGGVGLRSEIGRAHI